MSSTSPVLWIYNVAAPADHISAGVKAAETFLLGHGYTLEAAHSAFHANLAGEEHDKAAAQAWHVAEAMALCVAFTDQGASVPDQATLDFYIAELFEGDDHFSATELGDVEIVYE